MFTAHIYIGHNVQNSPTWHMEDVIAAFDNQFHLDNYSHSLLTGCYDGVKEDTSHFTISMLSNEEVAEIKDGLPVLANNLKQDSILIEVLETEATLIYATAETIKQAM